jgi:hypothetical protein
VVVALLNVGAGPASRLAQLRSDPEKLIRRPRAVLSQEQRPRATRAAARRARAAGRACSQARTRPRPRFACGRVRVGRRGRTSGRRGVSGVRRSGQHEMSEPD